MQRQCIGLILIFIIGFLGKCSAEKALAGVELQFESEKEQEVIVYMTFSASKYEAPSINEPFLTKLYSLNNDLTGCGSNNRLDSFRPPDDKHKWTIVLMRGGSCNFHDKIKRAQDAGASAVIIVNTVKGLYNQTSGDLMNSCSLNCDVTQTSSHETCRSQGGCYSCGENIKIGSGSWCCVDDSLIDMYIGKGIEIPAFFASIEDGEKYLLPNSKEKRSCTIFERPSYEIDPSVFLIGGLGCLVLALGSYRAVSRERSLAKWIWSVTPLRGEYAHGEIHEDHDHEQFHLSVAHAGCFVVTSAFFLGFLFFLVQYFPHAVVRILQFFFAIGATGALAKLLLIPLISRVSGTWGEQPFKFAPAFCMDDSGQASTARIAATTLSAVIAFTWLWERHERWAWVLLDILAGCLATSFLLTIRLPNLRVGTALLSAFFFYDIFMVFITPSIFAGRSIMVDVATAGRAREHADATKCFRQREESVPMLFLVPRMDWYGGYALLGLGDIVLPGLLIVLALRFDYAKLRHRHRDFQFGTTPFPKPTFLQIHAYWIPLVISYAVGLALTFVANINGWTFNGVRGQPALLYLVPCTLGCFYFLMWRRGDGSVVWNDSWLEWEAELSPSGTDEDDQEAVRFAPSSL
jgi:signal peptide peptidase-like protein 2B